MKDFLMGLLVITLVVAVLVAGYYLGIVMAVFSGLMMLLGIVGFIILLASYSVWELVQNWKAKRQRRDP